MSEYLRRFNQLDNQTRGNDFEEIFHRGLTLPVNTPLGATQDKPSMQEVFLFWMEQSGIESLPPGTALVLTDKNLEVIECAADPQMVVYLPLVQGSSWARSSIGDNAFARSAESASFSHMHSTEHESSSLVPTSTCAVSIYSDPKEYVGQIGLITQGITEPKIVMMLLQTLLISLKNSALLLIEKRKNDLLNQHNLNHEHEAKKRDVLYQAAKKLHAKIDVDSVLSEVIDSIHNVYPHIQVDLLLTQDSQSTSLPVKPLNFQSLENDLCTRAFMEGHLIFESSTVDDNSCYAKIAAPLSGKQGVYGVLCLQSEHNLMAASDIQFISMLADTAGSAFENAKLYEQSNFLINELRLINEITKRLNQSLRLNEIFDFASSELLNIFGADYCCILQTDKAKEKLIVQASNLPAIYHENFRLDEGFSGLVYTTQEPLIISDYWANSKVDSKLMELTDSRSLIASPITVNGEVVGVILVVHNKPNFFSYDNYKLLQVLSGHIGLAMTNASLHAEVNRMVITDNLTNLFVRHYLDEQANMMQKKDFCGSLIVVDIDNFKRVNDTYGHQVGDQILIQVSQIIKTSVRELDIAARWGGEELAIYLPHMAKDQTMRIAERVRARVMQETNPQVTVSCGVSDWSWDEEKISVESLFYRADMALYQAKNGGRNQIRIG